ncbi:MAG: exosortase U [Planctomycetaceae bacterium]
MENDFDLPELGEDALPEEMNGFRRQQYETVARVQGDPFGQASQQWTYRRDAVECLISVDYPYSTPHDLTVCYTNIGWKVIDPQILAAEDQAADSRADGPMGQAALRRPLYGNAMLLFNHTNLNGTTNAILKDEVRGTTDERADRRWTSFFRRNADVSSAPSKSEATYVQYQLFARSATEITPEMLAELRGLFFEAKHHLKTRLQSSPDALRSP